ncbi:MAG: NAD-dependent epimerase/dehydratase family protein [Boseongicola sp.]|nr:NAD-dependent epimerase/dehydratase family protein [Boseongicola sp.]
MKRFSFKLTVLVLASLAATGLPWLLIGVWNRLFGGWRSIFFCYAGSRGYIDSYAFPGFVPLFRWRPSPIGIISQGGARGLVLAAPMTEKDFLDPANSAAFTQFQKRLRRIALVVGVDRITLAGIMPGVLRRSTHLRAHDTRPATVSAVQRAAACLVDECFYKVWPPIILIGGAGYVGAAVAKSLQTNGAEVHVVDSVIGERRLPDVLRGRPALMIDVARHGAIADYVKQMWPELVLLSETYPEPRTLLVNEIARQCVEVFHLAGVAGRVRPALPLGYANAVPCCAIHDAARAKDVQLVRLAPAKH